MWCCPGEAGSPQRGTAHRPPRSSEPLAPRGSIFFQHASGASNFAADARSARGTSAPSPPSLRRAHALRCRVVHAGERTCGCVADTARDRARRYAPAGCACAALSSNDLPHLQTFSADRAHDGPAAVRAHDFADCRPDRRAASLVQKTRRQAQGHTLAASQPGSTCSSTEASLPRPSVVG